MKLTKIIEVWDILHSKNIGELMYFEFQDAIEKVDGIQNDIEGCQPCKSLEK